jgi:hypothetical protein
MPPQRHDAVAYVGHAHVDTAGWWLSLGERALWIAPQCRWARAAGAHPALWGMYRESKSLSEKVRVRDVSTRELSPKVAIIHMVTPQSLLASALWGYP